MNNINHFILSSNPFEIDNLTNYLRQSLTSVEYNEDFFNQCLLILTEAVNNAMIHGNKRDTSKKVSLIIEVLDDSIKLVISDEGSGFKEENVPDPTLPENIFRDHGRGLFIMKHFTEEMYYSDENDMNNLHLTLKIKK